MRFHLLLRDIAAVTSAIINLKLLQGNDTTVWAYKWMHYFIFIVPNAHLVLYGPFLFHISYNIYLFRYLESSYLYTGFLFKFWDAILMLGCIFFRENILRSCFNWANVNSFHCEYFRQCYCFHFIHSIEQHLLTVIGYGLIFDPHLMSCFKMSVVLICIRDMAIGLSHLHDGHTGSRAIMFIRSDIFLLFKTWSGPS